MIIHVYGMSCAYASLYIIGVSASFGHHPLAMIIDPSFDDITCSSLSIHPNSTLILLPHIPSSSSSSMHMAMPSIVPSSSHTHHGHSHVLSLPPVPRFPSANVPSTPTATATPPPTPSTVTLHI